MQRRHLNAGVLVVGVDEERVAMPALLALVDEAECLVNSEHVRVEKLLVRAEMVAASGPATQ